MSTPPPAPAGPLGGPSHPWVYSATIIHDGTLSFRVEVTDLQATVGAIEISGTATQVNGAFAPIYSIVNISNAVKGDPTDPDQEGRYFADVQATATPDHPFLSGEDVTVFVRVAKVWVTVLGSGSKSEVVGQASPTWGNPRAAAQVRAT